jgi:hypothetical protein
MPAVYGVSMIWDAAEDVLPVETAAEGEVTVPAAASRRSWRR